MTIPIGSLLIGCDLDFFMTRSGTADNRSAAGENGRRQPKTTLVVRAGSTHRRCQLPFFSIRFIRNEIR
jgi:hypothetical protein